MRAALKHRYSGREMSAEQVFESLDLDGSVCPPGTQRQDTCSYKTPRVVCLA